VKGPEEVERTGREFLARLYEASGGERAGSGDMYQLGQELGLDKEAARRMAEYLAGEGLIEIRSLSGGIALSPAGLESARAIGTPGAPSPETELTERINLSSAAVSRLAGAGLERKIGAVLSPAGCAQARAAILTALTAAAEPTAELAADLTTLQAQLLSPRPRAGVVAETLIAILDGLERAGPETEEAAAKIAGLVVRLV